MSDESICQPEHVFFCFAVLESELKGTPAPEPKFDAKDKQSPLFVTWNKYRSADYSELDEPVLAGCIGQFSPQPLVKGLHDYALTSALKDHRFQPIRAKDLPMLQCQVSLLTPFEPISDPLDWSIGIHGIYLTFSASSSSSSSSQKYNACYLPEVASDQGWTKVETLKSLMRKAGYRGKVEEGDEVWKGMEVLRYRSEKCERSWREYVEWKEEHE